MGNLDRKGIHPSIYRQQLQVFAKNISETLQRGHIELANNARAQLKNFREHYAPWVADYQLTDDLRNDRQPANLILEKVAREFVLYPSNNPGKLLFFRSREEATSYAAKHFVACEIDVPSPILLPPAEAHEIANVFCQ